MTPHERWSLEAAMTKEQVRAYVQKAYDETKKVPARRFRVEGSKVGNSRLLTKQDAQKAMTLYGGAVAEYMPVTKRPQKQTQKGAHEW